MPRLDALDGFRAYAIAGVVALHTLGMSGALDAAGDGPVGVLIWGLLGNVIDGFFIISGFVLFLPVATRGEFGSVRQYAIARATRLVPAYWLVVALSVALAILVPPRTNLVAPTAGDVAIHLGALQMPARLFDANIELGFGVNGPLWMISIIVGFYCVLPFVAGTYLRHPFAGLALAALITVGWKEAALHLDGALLALDSSGTPVWVLKLIAIDQLPGWAFSFALGMTGAWLYVRLYRAGMHDGVARPASWTAGAALLLCAILAYLYGRNAAAIHGEISGSLARESVFLSLFYSFSRALLMGAVALGPLWLQRPFVNAPARSLARVSYGLYLFHLLVAIYVCELLLGLPDDARPATVVAWLALVFTLSAVLGGLSRRYVERPAARLRERPTQRRARSRRSRSGRSYFREPSGGSPPTPGAES